MRSLVVRESSKLPPPRKMAFFAAIFENGVRPTLHHFLQNLTVQASDQARSFRSVALLLPDTTRSGPWFMQSDFLVKHRLAIGTLLAPIGMSSHRFTSIANYVKLVARKR